MARVRPVVIDFETDEAGERPDYPPRPVGVAIDEPGRKPLYYAWGHPTENNCSIEQAKRHLLAIWRSGVPLLFWHMKFDLDVAEVRLGLKLPPWDRVHDGMFKLFLVDPHAPNLKLKDNAERLLGMEPGERDAVHAWLVDHKIVKKDSKKWGQFIHLAPGKLVGKYAIGDVVRTRRLDEHLDKKMDEGLWRAYDRERKLMPICLTNEREGMRVNVPALRRDVKTYQQSVEKTDAWLRKRMKSPDCNIDSPVAVVNALVKAKLVDEEQLEQTEAGNYSLAKDAVTVEMFTDARVYAAYSYRQKASTCLSVFMEHWLEQGEKTGGTIHTDWAQVRTARAGGNDGGAKTGRMQTSPPFQNLPKDWYDKDDGYIYPAFLGVPDLPLVRQYVLPDPGQLFTHRDYNQQELRLLAHFEDGPLLAQYQANPRLDVHEYVRHLLVEIMMREIERRPTKILNFGKCYGMGKRGFMLKTGCTAAEAAQFIKAHEQALPGVKDLEGRIKERAGEDEPIRTWGGRRYFCEPPSFSKKFKRWMTYDYKLLNYLIQGSAADVTKEAIIRLHEHPRWTKLARFLVAVHDEINASVPKKAVAEALRIQREVMQSIETDVAMLSDAKVGQHWGMAPKRAKVKLYDTRLRVVERDYGVPGGIASYKEAA